ncbi:MAG: Ig-like domain-containing protein [Candidatus Firestonebacteria bacterium]|nr:Ig-like domain-containing protein [Candidatus Firestonebacteria bacterium]
MKINIEKIFNSKIINSLLLVMFLLFSLCLQKTYATTWFTSTIESALNIGMYASMVKDSANKMHISYYDDTNKNLKYATNASGTWVIKTVDTNVDVGMGTSIAIDSNNKVYISYYNRNIYSLKYATDVSGTWKTYNIYSAGNIGGYTSIAVDTNFKIHISYYDLTYGDLIYATDTSGTWTTTTVDRAGDVGMYTSITVDSKNKIHISYYDMSNFYLKYATNSSGNWAITTVDSSSNVGWYSSITTDPNDKIHICYYDLSNGDLKYTTNASGIWVITTVDNSTDAGKYCSLSLDSVNKAHISYYDAANKDLKYATNASGAWVTATIDSAGRVGEYTSIVVDSAGKVHIAYYDFDNGNLKYTYGDTIPPVVILASPSDKTDGVPINTSIIAIFSEALNAFTINTSTFTLKDNGNNFVSGTVNYNVTTASFTPLSNLSYNMTYTATLTTGVKDSEGNPMIADFIWSFTTGIATDTEAPTVSLTSPSNNATGVAVNTRISAAFSELMNASTIDTNTFILKDNGNNTVSGTVTYTGATASFTPSSNLAYNMNYTATLSTGVKDLAGNPMTGDYTWNFTTGDTPDTEAPEIILTNPSDNAADISVNTKIAVVFSEQINASTINTNTFILKYNENDYLSGTVSYNGTVAVFTPLSDLTGNTTYTVIISTGIKDLANNPISGDYIFSFTTSGISNKLPPSIVMTTPSNNAASVDISSNISVLFSDSMDTSTINASTFTLKNNLNNIVPGVVNLNGKTAVFAPSSKLEYNMTYKATISKEVKNSSGIPMTDNYTWSFTTLKTKASSSKGSKGACLIKSIMYESSHENKLKIFCRFRDTVLINNFIGRDIAELYYKVSTILSRKKLLPCLSLTGAFNYLKCLDSQPL